MTNKYSELSDFEINKLVARKQNLVVVSNVYHTPPDAIECKLIVDGRSFSYNPTQDHQSAMALMIKGKINLLCDRHINPLWIAKSSNFYYANAGISVENENPCRAIAECFLLVKDAENNNDK